MRKKGAGETEEVGERKGLSDTCTRKKGRREKVQEQQDNKEDPEKQEEQEKQKEQGKQEIENSKRNM